MRPGLLRMLFKESVNSGVQTQEFFRHGYAKEEDAFFCWEDPDTG